jgi:hypothetical protein
MEQSVNEHFMIMAINPENGRVAINNLRFRYSLTGALLMDFLDKNEFTTEKKRLIPSLRMNGEILHDLIAEIILKSPKPKRISFWIRRLTRKSRLVFNETIRSLENQNLIRKERSMFLNIIPYNRYWFVNKGIRINLIEEIRNVLIHGKQPSKRNLMLMALIEASRCHKLLARDRSEVRMIRRRNSEIIQKNDIGNEINQIISEIETAIIASVIAASAAAGG